MSAETFTNQVKALEPVDTVEKKMELLRLKAIWFGYIRQTYMSHLALTEALNLWKQANSQFGSPYDVENYFTKLN